MSDLAQHVMLRLRDDRVIAPDAAARRRLARTVLELGRGRGLLCFRGADTHVHLLVLGQRSTAAELARRIEIALALGLGRGVGFSSAHLRPVESQQHLLRAFWYVLRQDERHGLDGDAFHDASSLPDLLGARVLGSWTAEAVRAALPRVRREELAERLGLSEAEPAELSLAPLEDAASAAIALPNLRGRTADVVSARRAALAVARDRARPGDAAAALGLSERTARHMLTRGDTVSHALVRAVRMQLVLRQPRSRRE